MSVFAAKRLSDLVVGIDSPFVNQWQHKRHIFNLVVKDFYVKKFV